MTINIPDIRIRRIITQLIQAGLDAANPDEVMKRAVVVKGHSLRIGGYRYDFRNYDRVMTVGAGKASAQMARTLEQLLGNRLTGGLVVTKDKHRCPTQIIEIREARHPVPDQRGERAGKDMLDLMRSLTSKDLVFALISGGASSLLPVPAKGLTLADKQKTTNLLLRSGATIQEVNTVRKHLSVIKGGQLATSTKATVISLILSDVLGDDVGTIGSGLTAPDPTIFSDAQQILQSYKLWKQIPVSVQTHIHQGIDGKIPETPKPGSKYFRQTHNEIIGNNALAVANMAKHARKMNIRPLLLTTTLTGEAREVANALGSFAHEIHRSGKPIKSPACIIMGGEPTVRVRGKGKGGRTQEFALSAAIKIAGIPNVWIAAFGTDGTDGPTDAAGAVVDGQTIIRARQAGLDPIKVLANNDSYNFFKNAGGHIKSGPTGTNVNDLYLLLAL